MPGITRSEVDLQRRTVRVEYRSGRDLAATHRGAACDLGYEPVLVIRGDSRLAPPARRRLYLQLGVAGFAFGNIMLFSIPRYANGGPLSANFSSSSAR